MVGASNVRRRERSGAVLLGHGDHAAAPIRMRLAMDLQSVLANALGDTCHQRLPDAADDRGVFAGQRIERAVPKSDLGGG